MILSIDADGRAVQDVYNAVGEETQENWLIAGAPASAGYSVFHTINTYYDADGDTTGVIVTDTQDASNATNYEYSYDADGNVLTSRMAPGDLVQGEGGSDVPSSSNPVPVALTDLTYTYYGNGSTASVTDGSDISSFGTGYTDYSYNALSQVVNEWQGVNTSGDTAITAESKQANFTYNGAGQTATITTYGDGFDGEGGTEVAKGTYSYDAGGRLTSLGYTNASSDGIDAYGTTTPISYTVAYDPASNITSVASADGADTLTLDNASQLTSASLTSETYSYDQNGNRVGGGYVTGADNLLLSDGTYNYQYDKDGNLVKRTNISTGAVTLYAWNDADELTQVTSRTGTGFGSYVTMTVTYAYDSFGNVIRETVTNDSSGGPTGPATTTYTVYNGANPYLTVTDTNQLADGGATAAINQRDLYGQAVDQILATDACTGSSSGVLFGLADYQGTICDVVNASGTEVSGGHVKFNSFGLPTAGIDSLVADFLFGKAGMRYDPSTGLYDDGLRVYNPFTGKFQSPDPTGMAGSGTNLEAYCGNSPLQNVDPSGLCYTGLGAGTGNNSGMILDNPSSSAYSLGTAFAADMIDPADSGETPSSLGDLFAAAAPVVQSPPTFDYRLLDDVDLNSTSSIMHGDYERFAALQQAAAAKAAEAAIWVQGPDESLAQLKWRRSQYFYNVGNRVEGLAWAQSAIVDASAVNNNITAPDLVTDSQLYNAEVNRTNGMFVGGLELGGIGLAAAANPPAAVWAGGVALVGAGGTSIYNRASSGQTADQIGAGLVYDLSGLTRLSIAAYLPDPATGNYVDMSDFQMGQMAVFGAAQMTGTVMFTGGTFAGLGSSLAFGDGGLAADSLGATIADVAPDAVGQVGYGSTDLSQLAIQARNQTAIFSARNVAVVEYSAIDGSLQTLTTFSERGVGHAERLLGQDLQGLGIDPSDVTRFYSELEPCTLPGGYCKNFIANTYPQASVTWSFEYGADAASRQAGLDALKQAIGQLKNGGN